MPLRTFDERFKISTKTFQKDANGFVLALYAIGFAALILSAALAINFLGIMSNGVSRFGPLQERARMQMVADAAARAAAVVALRLHGAADQIGQTRNEAQQVAALNNYDTNVTVHIGSEIKEGNWAIPDAVEVIIEKPYNFLFSSGFLNASEVTLKVRAVAAWLSAPAVIALNNTSKNPTGITVSGGAQINIPGGVYSNDPDLSSSIKLNGSNTQLCSNYFGMVGGTDVSALCGLTSGGRPIVQTGGSPVSDPLAPFVSTPSNDHYTLADYGPAKTWNDVTAPLLPGTYDSKIDLSTGTLTFSPGTYYFNKSLNVTGGKIDAPANVTLVFQPGSGGFSVSGNSTEVTINAPPNGSPTSTYPHPGVAIATLDSSNQGFNSAGTIVNINGVIYAPSALISYNATKTGSNTAYNCLNIYAWAVSMAGGASLGRACPPDSLNTSSFQPASLVE